MRIFSIVALICILTLAPNPSYSSELAEDASVESISKSGFSGFTNRELIDAVLSSSGSGNFSPEDACRELAKRCLVAEGHRISDWWRVKNGFRDFVVLGKVYEEYVHAGFSSFLPLVFESGWYAVMLPGTEFAQRFNPKRMVSKELSRRYNGEEAEYFVSWSTDELASIMLEWAASHLARYRLEPEN